jgi:ketosteroid isomerase-like protein
MADEREELLRGAYAAFNARDIERALVLMDADVDWPNGMEGGRVRGHDEVREYWTRQFGLIDSNVEPVGFETLDDGRVAVRVHQVVRDTGGALLSDSHVRHVYSFREGLVATMVIEELGTGN